MTTLAVPPSGVADRGLIRRALVDVRHRRARAREPDRPLDDVGARNHAPEDDGLAAAGQHRRVGADDRPGADAAPDRGRVELDRRDRPVPDLGGADGVARDADRRRSRCRPARRTARSNRRGCCEGGRSRRCTRACLSDDGTEVETHEHLGLQLDPTVPPGPEGPGGSGVDVVAAETGAVVTARAVSAVGALERSDDPVLAALAWTPTGDAPVLRAAARCLGDEDGCRRVSWRG